MIGDCIFLPKANCQLLKAEQFQKISLFAISKNDYFIIDELNIH